MTPRQAGISALQDGEDVKLGWLLRTSALPQWSAVGHSHFDWPSADSLLFRVLPRGRCSSSMVVGAVGMLPLRLPRFP